jgi:hypothetical protein
MKYLLNIALVVLISGQLIAQKTVLVEKLGTHRMFYYMTGDEMKLRVRPGDTILRGSLWDIRDSLITLTGLRSYDVKLSNIGAVYKQFSYPKKFAFHTAVFGGVIFVIIGVNHLINNEPVFSPDLFIISGSFAAASLISLSFSQKRCEIGHRWKVKVLDFALH